MGLLVPSLPFIAIALLVLIPTRRLFLAGWSSRLLVAYYLVVFGLAAIVAEIRAPARYLVPILVVAYIAPFVTAGAGIARLLRGRGGTGPGGSTADLPVVRRVEPIALPTPEEPPGDAEPETSDAAPAPGEVGPDD